MLIQAGVNVNTFFIILIVLNCFGVCKLKSRKSKMVEFLSRLLTFCLMLFYLWLGFSNTYSSFYTYAKKLTRYATDIDRSSKIFAAVAILFDAVFNRKNNLKVLKAFDKIDGFILRSFEVKLKYKKITIIFILLTIFNLTPVFVMLRHFLISMSIFKGFVLLTYVAGNLMLQTLETFYIAIVVQLFIRFKVIENFVDKKSDKFLSVRKFELEELMFKLFKLINSFNSSSGYLGLILVGECEN
jgi:hypothetical protein